MQIIDLSQAPTDPIQRIVWLGGVQAAVKKEVDTAFQEAYFDARIKGMLGEAISLAIHSRKRIMAWTRHANEARGRVIRHWNDGFA